MKENALFLKKKKGGGGGGGGGAPLDSPVWRVQEWSLLDSIYALNDNFLYRKQLAKRTAT